LNFAFLSTRRDAAMPPSPSSPLLAAAAAALLCCGSALALDESAYRRLAPGELQRFLRAQTAPQIPFVNFSAAYVARAKATPTNYTALGAVTPVKDQGPHGYCGTFGRMVDAEGQFMLEGNALTSFSEEMLIDCIGWDKDQFGFFEAKGLMTTADYPYNETDYPDQDPPIPGNPCRYDASKVVANTPGFFNATTGWAPDEDQLVSFIHHNGPVSVGINSDVFAQRAKGCDATSTCFITAADCAKVSQDIDHSVGIVGYGTDAVNGDYWISEAAPREQLARTSPRLRSRRSRMHVRARAHSATFRATRQASPSHHQPEFLRVISQEQLVFQVGERGLHQRRAGHQVRRHLRGPHDLREHVCSRGSGELLRMRDARARSRGGGRCTQAHRFRP
jgi:hypothetical protein